MIDEIRQPIRQIRQTMIGHDGTIMSSTGSLTVPVGRITEEGGIILFGDMLGLIGVAPEQMIGDLRVVRQNSAKERMR